MKPYMIYHINNDNQTFTFLEMREVLQKTYNNINIVVISSLLKKEMKQFLIDTDILQYVDFYIGKEENKNTEFQMYLEVLKRKKNIKPLIVVGERSSDISSAKELGLNTIDLDYEKDCLQLLDILKTIQRERLANMFDHTLLKAYASKEDFEKLCQEAHDNHFAMVAINSSPVKLCKEILKDSPVHVGAAISFPLGQTSIETKVFETQKAIEDGADEIDYVINIGELKNGNLEYIEKEMKEIVSVCKENHVLSKVIFENCYLTKEEIKEVALIAKRVEPDFIKTSTGFGTSGATVEDVLLMKEIVGDKVQVKAAGGIRDYPTAKAMIEAGASRIGTSSSLLILKGFDELYHF